MSIKIPTDDYITNKILDNLTDQFKQLDGFRIKIEGIKSKAEEYARLYIISWEREIARCILDGFYGRLYRRLLQTENGWTLTFMRDYFEMESKNEVIEMVDLSTIQDRKKAVEIARTIQKVR